MQYTEVTFVFSSGSVDLARDLLIYSLGEDGPYDSFVETPKGLKAYVPTDAFSRGFLEDALCELRRSLPDVDVDCSVQSLPDKDWNEEWERQHQPVLVDGAVWVRAPFHPHRSDVEYEIEIEPKMSFGTAHHPTTHLMLSLIRSLDVKGKRVLDMGCGTGILAILAAKCGAGETLAIDVDEWAYRNALENVARNNVRVDVRLGDAQSIPNSECFDYIFANINRNILLHDMHRYVQAMRKGGHLLLSGFYETDIEALTSSAASLGLSLQRSVSKEGWAGLLLTFNS